MEKVQTGVEIQAKNTDTPSDIWTIKKLLAWSCEYLSKYGSDTPRLDAQILLSHALKCPRIDLLTQADKPLVSAELMLFKVLIKRRALREPIAYIIGEKGFMNHSFRVNSSVLVPRPETELLVELIVEYSRIQTVTRILEIGTGSGCIALSLAELVNNVYVEAWDNSTEALTIAELNKSELKYNNCHFVLKDALDLQSWQLQGTPSFDILVSNPPYLRESEYANLQSDALRYEPKNALVAGEDGLVFYQTMAQHSRALVKTGGCVFLEIGYQQAGVVKDIFNALGWADIKVYKDFNRCDRVVVAKNVT